MPKKQEERVVERENAIDAILDPENGNNIVLLDGNGNEHEFEQVAIVPLLDSIYVILRPFNDPNVKANEAVVFVIELDEEDLEYYLDVVEDDDVIDAVFDEYTKMYEEEVKKAEEKKAAKKTAAKTATAEKKPSTTAKKSTAKKPSEKEEK